MRIAQIAPLIESVPPRLYGGTERIVSYLTDELVAHGHDVTLFASGDSITSATLVACCPQALRLNSSVPDPRRHHMLMLDKVRSTAAEFDVLHFHVDRLHFPMFRDIARRTVTTLHGRQDRPDRERFYNAFPEMPLVAVSHAQRTLIPKANVVGIVHHGLPPDLLRPTLYARGGYLAVLGRISPEKRIDHAIAIARAVGLPIKIAAKIDPVDEPYYRSEIQPLLSAPNVAFMGEINDAQKSVLLGNAHALVFPIDWPEPFGLVLIESMACGTPVLAFRHGAVPDIVDDGITGRIVESVAEAICKVGGVLALNRCAVRRRFEARFTAHRMAEDYLRIYQRLIKEPVPRMEKRPRDLPPQGGVEHRPAVAGD
jgi:glycosyltransferase involved in cell wall biosynthesis